MRGLVILAMIFTSVPVTLIYPHVGILMWSWLAYMNPQQMSWGWINALNLSDIVAGATIIGLILSREPKLPLKHPLIVLIVLYAVWTSITTLFAIDIDLSTGKWLQAEKVFLFALFTAVLMRTRVRIWALIWVISISIGYFGIKGGLFTIATLGRFHVMGVPASSMAGTNGLALALVMLVPLVRFLQLQIKNSIIRIGVWTALPLILISILGSQSRGAFLAATAMLMFLAVKSGRKFYVFVLISVGLIASFVIMPDQWRTDMQSIANFETDRSVQGRFDMWKYAVDVANDRPIVGGGYDIFYHQPSRARLLPQGTRGRASHSIYFEVLGEHGYVGFILFLAIGFATYLAGSTIIRRTKHVPELAWARDLAGMLQVSLVGYAVGGAFINVATFGFYWQIVAVMAVMSAIVRDKVGARHEMEEGQKFAVPLPTRAHER